MTPTRCPSACLRLQVHCWCRGKFRTATFSFGNNQHLQWGESWLQTPLWVKAQSVQTPKWRSAYHKFIWLGVEGSNTPKNCLPPEPVKERDVPPPLSRVRNEVTRVLSFFPPSSRVVKRKGASSEALWCHHLVQMCKSARRKNEPWVVRQMGIFFYSSVILCSNVEMQSGRLYILLINSSFRLLLITITNNKLSLKMSCCSSDREQGLVYYYLWHTSFFLWHKKVNHKQA